MLVRLRKEHIEGLENKKIVIAGYSEEYLKEIYDEYPTLPFPEFVLDNYSKRQGRKEVFGKELYVYGNSKIADINEKVVFILATGYYENSYESMKRDGALEKTDDDVYYFVNKNTGYYQDYNEIYKDSPLLDLVLFRSGPGASYYVRNWDFADNARALFEYMAENGYTKKYELVWLVKNPSEFKHIEDKYENVHFISFDWAVSENKEERDIYYRALCRAKYIFFTEACAFCRYPREDQIRVQLWHGSGFKSRTGKSRFEEKCEYHTVSSELYAEVHSSELGVRKDQIRVTGNPKDDWIYHPIEDWNSKLNIPKAGHYIFWLPTFRTAVGKIAIVNDKAYDNETGIPVVDTLEQMNGLNEYLKSVDTCMVIKLHPVQDRDKVTKEKFSNIVFLENETLNSQDVPINRVLAYADALISDYSSVAVDYLLLDRPLAFTLDDADDYEKNRGFVFSPIRDWLPGALIDDYDEFMRFIRSIAEGDDYAAEKRKALLAKMHAYRDDKNSLRVLNALGIAKD